MAPLHSLCILFLTLFALPAAHAQEEAAAAPQEPKRIEVPQAVWTQVDNIARQLAKGGREKEFRQFWEIIEQLRMPEAQAKKLEEACIGEMKKVTKVAESLPDAAKRLKTVARQVWALTATAEEAEKVRVARWVLRMDDSVEEAHKLLGHELVDKHWMSAEEKATRARKGEILEAMGNAGRLNPELEVSENVTDELMTRFHGEPCVLVQYGKFRCFSTLSLEKTRRMVTEILRAQALSQWLRGGPLELPKKGTITATFYMIDSRVKFDKAVEYGLETKALTPEEVKEMGQVGNFGDKKGTIFQYGLAESDFTSAMFVILNSMQRDAHSTTLFAGHVNWVSLAMLGTEIPGFVWKNKSTDLPRQKTYVDNPAERKLREEKLQLARAGILGCRSWVSYLAERNEDPRWENTFLDELGKIRGEDLLKATTVVEYMQELNILKPTLDAMRKGKTTDRTYNVIQKALGVAVTEFEARWRVWIVAKNGGLAQAVDKQTRTDFDGDELSALEYLNNIRKVAFAKAEGLRDVPDLKLERDLCEGAQKHAEYLNINREQLDAWPDAHEEYRDKEGYTSEGHWAGTHANIGGGRNPEEAIDGWMGTYYHRLPMLVPELKRIGWGQVLPIAVIDVQSFVTPPESQWVVVWPAADMKDVPTDFANGVKELPNPVPSEPDQDFGYPVTLQLGQTDPKQPSPEISLRVFEGKEIDAAKEIKGWLSTPSKPSNPDSPTPNAWCFIPKGELKPGTTYTCSAEWYVGGKKLIWSFKTR
jgi:uncharacterized protein YkwD